MDSRFWHLKRCDLFERLTPEQVQKLESRCRSREFPRGGLVYLPTDAGDSLLLLTSGRVKIYHVTAEGKQAVLSLVDPGEVFGELAVFGNAPREEFAEAMDASTLVLVPRDAVQQLMEEHPSVALGVTKLMGLRRRRVERRLKSLLFRSNRERLVHLLLELAEKYGRPTVDGVLLSIRLSHQELASIVGSTRETVTVLLGELQGEGVVRIERRRLLLRDLDRLAASVHVETPPLPVAEDLGNRLLRQARAKSG